MGQIYYCTKCKKTFSSDDPAYVCSNCGGSLLATGVPVEVWRALSIEEKTAKKDSWNNIQTAIPVQAGDLSPQSEPTVAPVQAQADSYELKEQTKYLKKLAHDVHFLYVIAVIQVVLWIFGILVIVSRFT